MSNGYMFVYVCTLTTCLYRELAGAAGIICCTDDFFTVNGQ